MVFGIFSKRKEEEIDRSIKKYKRFLHDNLNLGISITYDKNSYCPDIEKFVDREIVIRLTAKDRDIIKYKIGQVVKVEFTSGKSGIYETKIKITKKTVDEYNVYYEGIIVSPIEKIQRRGSYRLPVHMGICYTLLPNKLKTYNGIAKDISASGMRMESRQFVNKGRKIQLNFEINKQMYKVEGLVIGTRYDKINEMNIHHIRFEGLSHKESQIIHDYIFREQKKRIKSGSGII